MKRSLLENIKSTPYTPGTAVNRLMALSAAVGIHVSAAAAGTVAKITVTHSDAEDGTFEAVPDERIFLDDTVVERDAEKKFVQAYALVPVAAGQLVNVDIDLVGCKQFIQVNVAFVDADGEEAAVTAAYALSLGDYTTTPVPTVEA